MAKRPMVDMGTAMVSHTAVGDTLPVVRRMVTRNKIDAYRHASGDNNRIHYDDEFAAATRFGGVIAHGMLTLTLVSEMMTKAYGADWLTSGSLRVRFRGRGVSWRHSGSGRCRCQSRTRGNRRGSYLQHRST